MAKAKSKSEPMPDALVLGAHPACYLAAAVLAAEKVPVLHATIPGEAIPDRLVSVNPVLFDLHPLLAPLKKKLDLTPINGLRFLADDPKTEAESIGKDVVAYVGSYKKIHEAVVALARSSDAKLIDTKSFSIDGVNEKGVTVSLNGRSLHPKLLLVGGALPVEQAKALGIPKAWDVDVPARYSYVKFKSAKSGDPVKPVIVMSLDLGGKMLWGWMLQHGGETQLAVLQSRDNISQIVPVELMKHWIGVLEGHRLLKVGGRGIDLAKLETVDLPLTGALSQEGVANRALLIGPAGGFYTACAEDIYPNCWSALFAADVAKNAIAHKHPQDALNAYRETWGSTLGDYLRGPQQNLRFLLPLVYRNPVMTARMTEAILTGTSVVR